MTAYQLAQRFIGVQEVAGGKSHPLIEWWLSLCFGRLDVPDETPWCSAFVNGVAWLLGLDRSGSGRARSWLTIGAPVTLGTAIAGYDIVILNRKGSPDPKVLDSPGHVGFFSEYHPEIGRVTLLGGNQGDGVRLSSFPVADVLGVRRLA